MIKLNIVVESSSGQDLKTSINEARHMIRQLNQKTGNKAGYEIISINSETGMSRKIISRSCSQPA